MLIKVAPTSITGDALRRCGGAAVRRCGGAAVRQGKRCGRVDVTCAGAFVIARRPILGHGGGNFHIDHILPTLSWRVAAE
jgi:hypothetical protein